MPASSYAGTGASIGFAAGGPAGAAVGAGVGFVLGGFESLLTGGAKKSGAIATLELLEQQRQASMKGMGELQLSKVMQIDLAGEAAGQRAEQLSYSTQAQFLGVGEQSRALGGKTGMAFSGGVEQLMERQYGQVRTEYGFKSEDIATQYGQAIGGIESEFSIGMAQFQAQLDEIAYAEEGARRERDKSGLRRFIGG